MDTYGFQTGQAISMTTRSPFYRDTYESTILSVHNSVLEIRSPYKNGFYIPLNIDCKLNMTVSSAFGQIQVTGKIVDRNISKHTLKVDIFNSGALKTQSNFNKCKFITVTSGKGGVGKTAFIINYAISLARKGKKVALLDADLGMANVDVLLKLCPRYNLVDVIDGSRKLSSILIDGPEGIKFVPGGSGIQGLSNLSSLQFNRIISGFEYLEKNFDYVLIDTGAGLSTNITNFIFSSDETIIMTTPEPHAITDAYSIIKVILDSNRNVKLALLINRCESSNEGKFVSDKIINVVKRFLDYNLTSIGFLPETRIVSKSIRKQSPFIISYQNSDIARTVECIAENEVLNKKTTQAYIFSSFASKFKSFFMH